MSRQAQRIGYVIKPHLPDPNTQIEFGWVKIIL